jgi:hypothetical protein
MPDSAASSAMSWVSGERRRTAGDTDLQVGQPDFDLKWGCRLGFPLWGTT